jgi:hypothetical protein
MFVNVLYNKKYTIQYTFCQDSSADYIFTELYNIYPAIRISMDKLKNLKLF